MLHSLPFSARTPSLRTRWARIRCTVVGIGLAGTHFAGTAALLCVPGCTPVHNGPGVASGEHPATGNARYDAFFTELSRIVLAVPGAEREVADAQAALARRLGLPDDVRADVLGTRLRERSARLAVEGLTLQLDFTGIEDVDATDEATANGAKAGANGEKEKAASASAAEATSEPAPTATLRTPGREPEPRELRLLEVLATSALSGASVYAEMGHAQHRLHALGVELGELRAQAIQSFPNVQERDKVLTRLTEADMLLGKLGAEAHGASNAADTLISLLDEAANTAPRKRPAAREAAPRESAPKAAPRPAVTPPEEGGAAADRKERRPNPKGAEPTPAAPTRPRDFEP